MSASSTLPAKGAEILRRSRSDSSNGVSRMERAMIRPAFVAVVSVTPMVSNAMVPARRTPRAIPGSIARRMPGIPRAPLAASRMTAEGRKRAHITAAALDALARSLAAR